MNEEVKKWSEFYKLYDDETALRNAVDKAYPNLTEEEREAKYNEIEVIKYEY